MMVSLYDKLSIMLSAVYHKPMRGRSVVHVDHKYDVLQFTVIAVACLDPAVYDAVCLCLVKPTKLLQWFYCSLHMKSVTL